MDNIKTITDEELMSVNGGSDTGFITVPVYSLPVEGNLPITASPIPVHRGPIVFDL